MTDEQAESRGADVVKQVLAASPDRVHADTSAHLNGKFVESLELVGTLRDFVRGDGVYLWDAEGDKYLDLLAGYGSVPIGHNHPTVRGALRAVMTSQVPHFILTAPESLPAALARRLAELAPGALEMAFLSSSGSEAVDGALKLARAVTHRTRFVYASGAYHGATFGAISVTDDPRLNQFGPRSENVRVPWGDLAALGKALRRRDIAAVILEPIQGEGGIRLPPPGYLAEVSRQCKETGTVFILDEVQTGFGRTGSLFACEREHVVPDVLVLGKALSAGMVPASAYLTTRDLWRRAYGDFARCELHCTTYRGGPLACAAALAAIDVIMGDSLAEHAAELGDYLSSQLNKRVAGHAMVREIRGRGLLWGIELATPRQGMASALIAQWVVLGLLERGFLTQVCTLAPSVIRIQPPLTVSRQQIDNFLDGLTETLRDHANGRLRSLVSAGKQVARNRLSNLRRSLP